MHISKSFSGQCSISMPLENIGKPEAYWYFLKLYKVRFYMKWVSASPPASTCHFVQKNKQRREEEGFVVSCEIYSSVVFILKLWFGFESENLAVRISLYCNRYPEYFWLEVSNASPTRHLLTPPPKLHEKIADWLISVRYETLALTLLVPSPERKIKKVIFLFSHFFVVPQKVLWRQGLYFNTTIRNARDGKG